MVVGTGGFPRAGSKFSDHSEAVIKMESVKIPKALQQLLLSLPTLPKENNGEVLCTLGTQSVSSDATNTQWSSNGLNNSNFVEYFPEVLEVLVMLLTRDDNPGWQLRALQALEDLVATPDAKIKAKVVDCAGALTGLLVLLANDNNHGFQARSALIIKHLASGNSETKATISDHPGALHGLVVSLSKDSNSSLQQNAAWALGILAVGNLYDCNSKTSLKSVLKRIMSPLEDETYSDLLETLASRSLVTGGGVANDLKARDCVPTCTQFHDMRLKMLRMQMEIPSVGAVFEKLDSYLQDFEVEDRMGQEEIEGPVGTTDMEDDVRKTEGRRKGCHPLRPLLWPARLFSKGKVAALPASELDEARERSDESLTNDQNLPLEALLAKALEGNLDPRQQRQALQTFCDRIQVLTLDSQVAAALLAQPNPEALKGLVSLLASPSLRGLAKLALKNLAANDQAITAAIVGLLVSLTAYTNPFERESSLWGLCSLAADSDGVKAEIVNQPGALKALVALMSKDADYCIRGTAARAFRNLAAAGDSRIAATICACRGAVDGLVSSLSEDEETIEQSWKTNFELQKNAALALGHLACHRMMTAMIVTHPGTLEGLVNALTNPWSPGLQENAAFALGNLADGDPKTKATIVRHPGLLLGLTLALTKDGNRSPALLQHAAFAVGNLAEGDERTKAAIVDHPLTIHSLMVSLRENANPALQKNAARAVGILATGGSETKSKIVNRQGVIEGLEASSRNHDNIGMRRHLKWASRNLGDNDDVETVAKTRQCEELWKAFSLRGGALPPNSTRSMH